MKPTWRKPAGMGLILLLIVCWVGFVASFSWQIGRLPWPLQLLLYGTAGVVWIAPLKPLLFWMEHGRWR